MNKTTAANWLFVVGVLALAVGLVGAAGQLLDVPYAGFVRVGGAAAAVVCAALAWIVGKLADD